jgi:son of sevenless-like protein
MQGELQALYDISDPMANDRGYREALNDLSIVEQRDRCIPWLRQFRPVSPTNLADDPYTAVHLNQLRLVLEKYPITVRDLASGCSLINFQRYLKFMDRVKEVVHYKPPDLEQFRQLGPFAYLETQLGNLRMSPTSDDDLMEQSRILEAREISAYRNRTQELRTLGFARR